MYVPLFIFLCFWNQEYIFRYSSHVLKHGAQSNMWHASSDREMEYLSRTQIEDEADLLTSRFSTWITTTEIKLHTCYRKLKSVKFKGSISLLGNHCLCRYISQMQSAIRRWQAYIFVFLSIIIMIDICWQVCKFFAISKPFRILASSIQTYD